MSPAGLEADSISMPLFGGHAKAIADEISIDRMGSHPEAEQVKALHEEHNALRAASAAKHGAKCKTLLLTNKRNRDIRAALKSHDFADVLAGLRYRGTEWAEDREQHDSWSLSPWHERGIEAAIGLSKRGPPKRKWRDSDYGASLRGPEGADDSRLRCEWANRPRDRFGPEGQDPEHPF